MEADTNTGDDTDVMAVDNGSAGSTNGNAVASDLLTKEVGNL